MLQIAKYSQSTKDLFAGKCSRSCYFKFQDGSFSYDYHDNWKPSPTFAELFAFETDPEYLAKQKVYYLQSISAVGNNGETVGTITYDESQLGQGKTKKARKPVMTHCPHCGLSLKVKPAKLVLAA